MNFFKDKQGRIAVWQLPNLPLSLWAVSVALGWIWRSGGIHEVLALAGFGFIFTWAWLEMISGASYFRRSLGLIVLIYAFVSRFF